ncbi:MAG: YbbR-like domain-containing protein [Prevotella sp.]|nr:YbbR-like domain-containing protein [Prevotella sp.]
MADIFKSIRRFLFGWANREFLIFLFFLLVAGVFWMLTTLNESYEQELKVPVRITNIPSNVVITSGESDTLRFTVQDKGFSLITYLYDKEHQPLSIDYRRYAGSDGRGVVPATDLMRLLDARLPASAKATAVKPDTYRFYYNNGEKKTVPVKLNVSVETDMLYYIADTVMSTREVTVYATPEKLDSIHVVYTEPIRYKGLQDSLSVTARLRSIAGVKMVPSYIHVTFLTDMLTEVRIPGVEVKGVNMPPGKVLRTFPGKLDVIVVTGMKNSQTLTAEDFEIVADYNQFSADSTAQCDVFIRRQPASIKRLQIERQQVDYLIEEVKSEE